MIPDDYVCIIEIEGLTKNTNFSKTHGGGRNVELADLKMRRRTHSSCISSTYFALFAAVTSHHVFDAVEYHVKKYVCILPL